MQGVWKQHSIRKEETLSLRGRKWITSFIYLLHFFYTLTSIDEYLFSASNEDKLSTDEMNQYLRSFSLTLPLLRISCT